MWEGRIYCHLRVLLAEQQVLQALCASRFTQVRPSGGAWPVVGLAFQQPGAAAQACLRIHGRHLESLLVRANGCALPSVPQAAEQLAALTALLDRFPQLLGDFVPSTRMLLGAPLLRCAALLGGCAHGGDAVELSCVLPWSFAMSPLHSPSRFS